MNYETLMQYSMNNLLYNYIKSDIIMTRMNSAQNTVYFKLNDKKHKVLTDCSDQSEVIKQIILYCIENNLEILFDLKIFSDIRIKFAEHLKVDYCKYNIHESQIQYNNVQNMLLYKVKTSHLNINLSIDITFEDLKKYDFRDIIDKHPEEFL